MKKYKSQCWVTVITYVITIGAFATPLGYTEPPKTDTQIIKQLQDIGTQLSSLPSSLATSADIAAQTTNLQTAINNVEIAFSQFLNTENYQTDSNLTADEATDTHAVSATKEAKSTAQQYTQDNLENSLKWFVYSLYPDDDSLTTAGPEDKSIKFSDYQKANSLWNLTVATRADDSLYISQEKNPSQYSEAMQYANPEVYKKPKASETSNRDFDFANLIAPTTYTTSQQQAAEAFLKYAAKSTQNMANPLDFSAVAKSAKMLKSVLTNPDYQQYMLAMRNFLALRSIVISAFNQLIAERTPIPGLAEKAGLPSSFSSASPLQVEEYMANHRIQDPNWYASVQSASPATVQRKILVILAEIEHQNYEAQLQREQLLAQLAAFNVQISLQTSQMLMKQEAQKVNAIISPSANGASGGAEGVPTIPSN